MNLITKLASVSALSIGMLASSISAQAVTIDTTGPIPGAAIANPLATATTGTVFENVVGSEDGVRRSPWQGSSVDENALDSFYTSVSGGGSATYNFGGTRTSISFLWGSPDGYNDLDIDLIGGGSTVTINGADVQGPVAIGQIFVKISDVSFDEVVFRSGQNAFEYANVSAAVPIPAALPLFATALLGLGLIGRRRRQKA